MSSRVRTLEDKTNGVEAKLAECEKSCEEVSAGVSGMFDDVKEQADKNVKSLLIHRSQIQLNLTNIEKNCHRITNGCTQGRTTVNFLLDNIFVRFGTIVYRQKVGIPMGTNCAPLIADFVSLLL